MSILNSQMDVTMMRPNAAPQAAIKSQQGKRGHENDDHAAWFAVDRPDRQFVVHVGVVADGVTSTAGGAKASAIAVGAIEAALREADVRNAEASLGETAVIICARCHGVHRTLYDLRESLFSRGGEGGSGL